MSSGFGREPRPLGAHSQAQTAYTPWEAAPGGAPGASRSWSPPTGGRRSSPREIRERIAGPQPQTAHARPCATLEAPILPGPAPAGREPSSSGVRARETAAPGARDRRAALCGLGSAPLSSAPSGDRKPSTRGLPGVRGAAASANGSYAALCGIRSALLFSRLPPAAEGPLHDEVRVSHERTSRSGQSRCADEAGILSCRFAAGSRCGFSHRHE